MGMMTKAIGRKGQRSSIILGEETFFKGLRSRSDHQPPPCKEALFGSLNHCLALFGEEGSSCGAEEWGLRTETVQA